MTNIRLKQTKKLMILRGFSDILDCQIKFVTNTN